MTDPGIPVLKPPREFTAATLGVFDAEVAPHGEVGPPGLVVDLGPVHFISSAGLGHLVHLGHRAGGQGAAIALAGGRRAVVKLIRTVGLDAVMPHFPTVEEATAFLLGRQGSGD